MKHRDRVRAALSHGEPDRCPMQISFTPEFANRLRQAVNIAPSGHHNPHGGGNTYELERALDEDMLLTSVGWANNYYAGSDTYTDDWGVAWRRLDLCNEVRPRVVHRNGRAPACRGLRHWRVSGA